MTQTDTSELTFVVYEEPKNIVFLYHEEQPLDKPAWISYRDSKKVEEYLRNYPEIYDFVLASFPALVNCFGESVTVVLEVLSEMGEQTLVGWIQSFDDVEVGLAKLEQLDEEWFLKHLDDIGDKFNFNLE